MPNTKVVRHILEGYNGATDGTIVGILRHGDVSSDGDGFTLSQLVKGPDVGFSFPQGGEAL